MVDPPMVEEGEMKEPLISQVNLKEDFILFKNCFIDLGKIAFVEEKQEIHYCLDSIGELSLDICSITNFMIFCVIGSNNMYVIKAYVRNRPSNLHIPKIVNGYEKYPHAIEIKQSEYDTLKAFLMKRLKPEQVR